MEMPLRKVLSSPAICQLVEHKHKDAPNSDARVVLVASTSRETENPEKQLDVRQYLESQVPYEVASLIRPTIPIDADVFDAMVTGVFSERWTDELSWLIARMSVRAIFSLFIHRVLLQVTHTLAHASDLSV